MTYRSKELKAPTCAQCHPLAPGAPGDGVVPHTGIAAILRWSPTAYGGYGGLRPVPVDSGRCDDATRGR
jgi:hypothetical protein